MDQSEILSLINDLKEDDSTSLNLADKGLTSIPPEVFELTQLTELNLRENSISELSLIHI